MVTTKYGDVIIWVHPFRFIISCFFFRRVSLALVPKATNDRPDDSDEEPGTVATVVAVAMIDDEMKIATPQMEHVRS
ncbi:hypothetical protein NPIL_537211 [Nephila pilipes]|uniref:Uncharacterized protein n=1 Tax=Nephila pilipes TaxID=299642 RepID=A0A8X6TB46_NEPPI|nr:hypothetical protein NPIL_537211 [Nephila pilipes]